MYWLEQADPHHLRDPARIIAVRLVDLLRRQQGLHVPRLDADHRQLGRCQRIDQPLRQRPGLDPDPAKAHAERGQKGDDSVRLGQHFLLQDYLAGLVDNAHRRLFHRHIKTHEMHHLIAPSSMLEVEPTSIHSSSQKGLHTQHPRLSRSRRDTPSVGSVNGHSWGSGATEIRLAAALSQMLETIEADLAGGKLDAMQVERLRWRAELIRWLLTPSQVT